MNTTDSAWIRWGECDPYFAVITDPRYRSANITHDAKQEFFESGRHHVRYVLETCRRVVPGFAPRSALDFGCGVGRITIPLAEQVERVVGVDVSPAMLAEARANSATHNRENVEYLLSDDELSAIQGTFDLIHSCIVFQHIDVARGRELFKLLLDRLAPGGMAAIHVTFGKAYLPATWGQPPMERKLTRPGPDRQRGPTASRPDNKSHPVGDPEMQMNAYSLSELAFAMYGAGIQTYQAHFTDHGGELGVFLFFSKPGRPDAAPNPGATGSVSSQNEVVVRLRSLDDWQHWARERPFIFSPDVAAEIERSIRELGLVDPLSGLHHAPEEITIAHDNFRETIKAGHLISRHRFLLAELKHLASSGRAPLASRECTIYAPEALSDFALYMRGRYPRFLGSEHAESDSARDELYPVSAESLLSPGLKSNRFDAVILNEPFDRLPDIDRVLTESARILKRDGVLLATFPFAYGKEASLFRNGSGSADLVETPGWNMIARAKAVGFVDAYFSFGYSARHGVAGKGVNGVFVFVASKSPFVDPAPSAPIEAAAAQAVRTFPRAVSALIGLPRSGTTVFAATIGAHPRVKAVFEPWNAEKRQQPSTALGVEAFTTQFRVKPNPEQDLLFVKETGAEPAYLEAIDHLLKDARSLEGSRLIYIYRDPLHAFLSEIDARKSWWGEPSLVADSEAFSKWASRSIQALRRICQMCRDHDAICVDYESFVRDPAGCLEAVMGYLGLPYLSRQLDYFETLDRQEVRGDRNVERNPQAISLNSLERRSEELESVRERFAGSPLFGMIESVRKVAKDTLAARLPSPEASQRFLSDLDRLISS